MLLVGQDWYSLWIIISIFALVQFSLAGSKTLTEKMNEFLEIVWISFIPERLDWIEAGGAAGGVEAEEDADGGGKAQGEEYAG
jgi:hypothetical protein